MTLPAVVVALVAIYLALYVAVAVVELAASVIAAPLVTPLRLIWVVPVESEYNAIPTPVAAFELAVLPRAKVVVSTLVPRNSGYIVTALALEVQPVTEMVNGVSPALFPAAVVVVLAVYKSLRGIVGSNTTAFVVLFMLILHV